MLIILEATLQYMNLPSLASRSAEMAADVTIGGPERIYLAVYTQVSLANGDYRIPPKQTMASLGKLP